MALSLSSIITAALALQNREGLEKVTTRRIAEMLGVQGPALYRHVGSKQELLGHMYAFILAEGLTAMPPTDGWQDWLRQYAMTFRQVMLRYRDSARLVSMGTPAEKTQAELVPAIYHPLIEAGIGQDEAILAEGIISAYTLGWVSHEQNPTIRQLLMQVFDIEAAFSAGVDTVIMGLDLRFRTEGKERGSTRSATDLPSLQPSAAAR